MFLHKILIMGQFILIPIKTKSSLETGEQKCTMSYMCKTKTTHADCWCDVLLREFDIGHFQGFNNIGINILNV